MSEKRKPTAAELLAAAIAEIQLGIAMARSRGVICDSPQNIRVGWGQRGKSG